MSGRKPDWRDIAACRAEDPGLFFPKGDTGPWALVIEEAKAICRRCPALETCGQWALETRQEYGVWGGLSEAERRALLRRRGIRVGHRGKKEDPAEQEKPAPVKTGRPPAECGTRSAYQRHVKNKEPIDDACRRANTDADNRLRRTGSTKAAA